MVQLPFSKFWKGDVRYEVEIGFVSQFRCNADWMMRCRINSDRFHMGYRYPYIHPKPCCSLLYVMVMGLVESSSSSEGCCCLSIYSTSE